MDIIITPDLIMPAITNAYRVRVPKVGDITLEIDLRDGHQIKFCFTKESDLRSFLNRIQMAAREADI